MLNELKAGYTGKIGIVNVNAATTSTVHREMASAPYLKAQILRFWKLNTASQVDKSQQIATNYITEGCVGIFGTNEGSTVNVGNAIAEAGGKVVGVGFDKSYSPSTHKERQSAMRNGSESHVMGYEGMKSAKIAWTAQYLKER